MKTLRKVKIIFVIPILIFLSIIFMATHCVNYNPDMLFRLVGDIPGRVYNLTDILQAKIHRFLDLLKVVLHPSA